MFVLNVEKKVIQLDNVLRFHKISFQCRNNNSKNNKVTMEMTNKKKKLKKFNVSFAKMKVIKLFNALLKNKKKQNILRKENKRKSQRKKNRKFRNNNNNNNINQDNNIERENILKKKFFQKQMN